MIIRTFIVHTVCIILMIDEEVFTFSGRIKLTFKSNRSIFTVGNPYQSCFVRVHVICIYVAVQLFNHPLRCRHVFEVLIIVLRVIYIVACHVSYNIRTIVTFFRRRSVILCGCRRQLDEIQTSVHSRASQTRVFMVETNLYAHIGYVFNRSVVSNMVFTEVCYISGVTIFAAL